jgi:hypothetical protein
VFVTVELLSFGGIKLPCFFKISYVSAYIKPSHWLEVLITCSLSVEIVSIFKQDSVVAGLRCFFLPLDSGHGSVAKLHAQGAEPVPQPYSY